MKLRVKTSLIATGCNCQPRVCDWCPITGLIAYAASSELVLAGYDEATGSYRAFETVAGHGVPISSLRFARRNGHFANHAQESVLVTGSTHSEVCVWRVLRSKTERLFDCSLLAMHAKCALVGHMPILMAGAIHHGEHLSIGVISGSVFTLERCEAAKKAELQALTEVDCVKYVAALILAFDWIVVDESTILLAVGLSNGGVDVYSLENASSKLQRKISLPLRGAWIRDLAFASVDSSISLASASDSIIKTWTMSRISTASATGHQQDGELVVKNQRLDVATKNGPSHLEVKLESSFIAHDAPINSLRWHPIDSNLLLSSSMDKSVTLWSRAPLALEHDTLPPQTHWLPAHRMSSEVGGEASGLYDAVFSPCGRLVLFHSFFGSFHLWSLGSAIYDGPRPVTSLAVGGHFDSVETLAWDKNGNYLLSSSADKTTRLFGESKMGLYVEIARPQVHGHAVNCVASISSNRFISGGEEKIFRVFEAPSSFMERFASLAGLSESEMREAGFSETNTVAASQGELGLSNQAIELTGETISVARTAITSNSDGIQPNYPTESELSRHSLFPEAFKLYGHGFEVYAVAANHEGSVVATSCRASHEEHAVIMVWETSDWRRIASLTAHQLTVTQMAFAPNDRFLLSVSRDRTWNLFKFDRTVESGETVIERYYSTTSQSSRHSRIIWACAWSHDSSFFATGSRDKLLNLWAIGGAACEVAHRCNHVAEDPIITVDFSSMPLAEGGYLVAVGLESGVIKLLSFHETSNQLNELKTLDRDQAFSGAVKALRFRPRQRGRKPDQIPSHELAASSSTNVIKIFDIRPC